MIKVFFESTSEDLDFIYSELIAVFENEELFCLCHDNLALQASMEDMKLKFSYIDCSISDLLIGPC